MLLKTLLLKTKDFFKKNVLSVAASLIVISFWLAIIDLLEMFLTEWHYLWNSISSLLIFGVFIFLITTVLFLLEKFKFSLSKYKKSIFFLSLLLFFTSLIAHLKYKWYYIKLQEIPKFKSISKTHSLPGERVELLGRNFGEPWQKGTVMVGKLEFIIVSWNDERVVVEQPVPNNYTSLDRGLVLTNAYGNTLTVNEFYLEIPESLLEE